MKLFSVKLLFSRWPHSNACQLIFFFLPVDAVQPWGKSSTACRQLFQLTWLYGWFLLAQKSHLSNGFTKISNCLEVFCISFMWYLTSSLFQLLLVDEKDPFWFETYKVAIWNYKTYSLRKFFVSSADALKSLTCLLCRC